MNTLQATLANHPFFVGFGESHLQLLTGCSRNARCRAGDYLFREGEDATHFFVLREGRIAIETHIPGQGDRVLYTHDAGDIIGWSWLFAPYRWHFSARALTPVRLITLNGLCLRNKCETDHELGYEFLKRFADKVVYTLDVTRIQLLDMFAGEERVPLVTPYLADMPIR